MKKPMKMKKRNRINHPLIQVKWKKDEKNSKTKEKLKDFITKLYYSKLIDNIIYNTLNYNEIKGVYILSIWL